MLWISVKIWILMYFLVLALSILSCAKQKDNAEQISDNKIVSEKLPWSIRMTESQILRLADSLEYGESNTQADWNYQSGLFLTAVLSTGERYDKQGYLQYVVRVIDSFINPDGSINTYDLSEYNIDRINAGKVLLKLHRITGDDKYKRAAILLRNQLKTHPRTHEGGFWHKKIYPWQMWLDGIYMGSPFYAEFGQIFEESSAFDDVTKQIILIDTHTRDPLSGLRYHAWDESSSQKWANPENGCSPHFWGRAMGWYAMALVDVLDFIPQNHIGYAKIQYIFSDVASALLKFQDESSGLWFQVLDQAGRKGNYLEGSASSMFVYALAKGVRLGHLDPIYLTAAKRAYLGLLERLVKVDANGLVSLTQICKVAGLGGKPYRDGSYEYYISEPVVDNDLKGVGPFILASLEMEYPEVKFLQK